MRYTVLSNEIWQDDAFLDLDRDNKLFYYYLLSSPNGNAAGMFRQSEKIINRDMWEGASEMLYADTKLWKYDPEASVVLIPNYLKYNQAKNARQIKGLNNALKGLPETPLLIDFFCAFYKYSDVSLIKLFDDWITRATKAEALRIMEKDPRNRKAILVTTLLQDI